MPSPSSDIMTPEQVLAFLEHPFINFAAVAEAFYGDGRERAAQALRRRIYGAATISLATRQRITVQAMKLRTLIP